jgi:hypothetical protein
VVVTDARGEKVTTTLAPITVAPAPLQKSGPGPLVPAQPVSAGPYTLQWFSVAFAVLVGCALLAMGLLAAREEVRRQGEALVAGIEHAPEESTDDPSSSHGSA